jgi:hypothetical protein
MKNRLSKIATLLLTSPLYAGPPMITDDPFTPKLNEFEVNFASELEKSDGVSMVAPIVDINYGLFSNVQLTLETGYALADGRYKSDGVELALKYNFYQSDDFSIALYPQYLFYPIKTPFDEGESYALLVPMSFQLSEDFEWVSTFSYVYSILEESGHYEVGSYLSYTHEQSSYFLEGYFEEKPDEARWSQLVNVGYFYQYRDDLGFMFSVGEEINPLAKQTMLSYVGVQVVF